MRCFIKRSLNRRLALQASAAAAIVLAGGWALHILADDQAKSVDLPPAASVEIEFARHIQPILQQHCWKCHSARKQESGLRLDWRGGVVKGGDDGPAIVPGKSAHSELVLRIAGLSEGEHMPPKGPRLTAEQIGLVRAWIDQGAKWTGGDNPPTLAAEHWSFQPLRRPTPPKTARGDWSRGGLDQFVLARLEKEGLQPAAEADRYMLARRVSLDLVGLPPAPHVVESFVSDTRPDAYERLVDKLLADPGFGERWGRMWLDLARYADSKGYGSDPLRTIWGYRDWVIDALNRNMPFDEFTIDQIAGDLLPTAKSDELLATAYHRNTMANDEGGTDDEEFRVAAIKDRVDTTMQVWMGLTAGCAKCHSHKFDPLSIREYYQLFAFFNQTQDADQPDEEPRLTAPTPMQRRELLQLQARLAELDTQLERPSAELSAGQARWEQEVLASEKQWTALVPNDVLSAGGTKLEKQPDGSVLASGGPATDTYTITALLPPGRVTALAVEALDDERLPMRGPGLAHDGRFVLNELRLALVDGQRKPPVGRRLRIENSGSKRLLSLAEVQVFSGNENVAQRGTATQSSVDYEAEARRAIDGVTDGDFHAKQSVTHTKLEDNPWWEVDLGAATAVDRVVVWNRTDNNLQGRLANFRVTLLDEAGKVTWQTTVAQSPNPSVSLDTAGPRSVALRRAWAAHEQRAWPVSAAIDGDEGAKSGWGIAPQLGQPHVAVFETAAPIEHDGGALLQVTLVHSMGNGAKLGRLRLAVSTASPPPSIVPQKTLALLRVPLAERTPEAAEQVRRYYWSIAPELAPLREQMAGLGERIAALERQSPATPILRELPPNQQRATHVLIKSNFLTKGERVEAAVPAAFHPLGNGPANRLALARWLVDKKNPLTARVAVNRFWAQLFGTGIVETEEDFGTQGSEPSHPELLDYLAAEFMQSGWDIKALLRTIVTSSTYRQSSAGTAEAARKDPHNRMLARGPRGRLEAEMVRDQALAIAGLLSHKQGGPSVYPPQPDGLWRAAFNGERTWPTSMGEDRYRRGLYTFWRRTVPYPSMATFDAPSREVCTLRRISTNTPLQALVTLNDPAYVEAAQALARRIVREGGAGTAERAAFALRLALCRPPQPRQIDSLVALYNSELTHFSTDAESARQLASDPLGPLPPDLNPAELVAWTVVSNVVLNLDGVLTKR